MCKKGAKKKFIFALAILFLIPFLVIASREDNSYEQHDIAVTLFGLALILLFARISSLVEYFGQPSVLGELVVGVILGNLGLLGLHFF
jgi:branched-subunit amino acid transport protein AzlD